MKIAILSLWAHKLFRPDEPQPFGGAELQLVMLARELALRGVDVRFVTRGCGEYEEYESDGVRVVKLPLRRSSPRRILLGSRDIVWALRRASAGAVVQRGGGIETGLAARAARDTGARFVFMASSQWDVDGTHARGRGWLYGRFYLYGLRRAAAVIAQSEYQQRRLREAYGIESVVMRSAHPIPETVPSERAGVLWVGRCEPVKNPALAIDLAASLPDIPFAMVCPKANSEAMFGDIRRRAAGCPNLEFIPGLPFEQTDALFGTRRLFLCTSEKEGFPNTYVQALKWGTPVVSLNVNPDGLLNRFDCGACAEGDAARLAASLRGLCKDETRRGAMAVNARAYAKEHHDIRVIADRFHRILESIASPS